MITRKAYVIMDKNRKFIVQLDTDGKKIVTKLDDTTATLSNKKRVSLRILTYDTEGRAKSGLREAKFNNIEIIFDDAMKNDPSAPNINDRAKYSNWKNNILRNSLEIVLISVNYQY